MFQVMQVEGGWVVYWTIDGKTSRVGLFSSRAQALRTFPSATSGSGVKLYPPDRARAECK